MKRTRIPMLKYLLITSGLFLATGCSGERPIVPVSGMVTLDGKPLAGAIVGFQPIGNGKFDEELPPGSSAKTDAEGKYILTLIGPGNRKGAAIGKHRVMVTMLNSIPGSDEIKLNKIQLPSRYNSETTLTFDVPKGGTSQAAFDLSSAP